MLIGAFTFLAIAILMAIYLYKGTNPTLTLIAKIFLHLLVAAFLILLIAHFFSAVPPVPDEKKNLPI
ncbi:hypothetical protein Lsan_0148 [Legionella santicrucis]|uniref:Uncharacterized protein n=1 Tax=Legionella santicrucis TaxID=45074 RepID=A0A0W0ZLW9_9GAMM|nr:hypothetical protein [Legionella santicrucis]KTD69870.1 hypothetical protein Lsan_0148 [Legionella santicrucis]